MLRMPMSTLVKGTPDDHAPLNQQYLTVDLFHVRCHLYTVLQLASPALSAAAYSRSCHPWPCLALVTKNGCKHCCWVCSAAFRMTLMPSKSTSRLHFPSSSIHARIAPDSEFAAMQVDYLTCRLLCRIPVRIIQSYIILSILARSGTSGLSLVHGAGLA